MKKKFSTKAEIQQFKKEYTKGFIETEVISNVLRHYTQNKNEAIQHYCDFWWPKNEKQYGLLGVLQIMILKYAPKALEEAFGKPDFSFEGNSLYQNYVLDYDGLTVIASTKREVVLDNTPNLKEKLIQFEHSFCQFVIDYMIKHESELSEVQKESLKKIKNAKILNQDNQLNFSIEKSYINK